MTSVHEQPPLPIPPIEEPLPVAEKTKYQLWEEQFPEYTTLIRGIDAYGQTRRKQSRPLTRIREAELLATAMWLINPDHGITDASKLFEISHQETCQLSDDITEDEFTEYEGEIRIQQQLLRKQTTDVIAKKDALIARCKARGIGTEIISVMLGVNGFNVINSHTRTRRKEERK